MPDSGPAHQLEPSTSRLKWSRVGPTKASDPAGTIPEPHCDWVRRAVFLSYLAGSLAAQELQPRAYIPAPDGLNYFGIAYSSNAGGLLFDPSLPVVNTHVNANIVMLSFGQTFAVLGRTTQLLAVLPYVEANLNGEVAGAQQKLYRSGLADATLRYAVNLYGAPAMNLQEFADYRQGTIVGASITVTAPTGQYDPNRLINVGTNRWGFKPELGVSRAFGKWTIECAVGAWLYTENDRFYGTSVRAQLPLGSVQTHLVRLLPHRIWIAGDLTYFTGGRTQTNGQDNENDQRNSRWGATLGIGLSPRQAIKLTFFDGLSTRVGGDIRSIGISYNVVWLRGRLP